MSRRREIRPLTADDKLALATFECALGSSRPWEMLVQEQLQTLGVDAIDNPSIGVIGTWSGPHRLDAVVVFHRRDNRVLWVDYLAVRVGAKRRGLGRELKMLVLSYAWEQGAEVVASLVHEDNDAMLAVNQRLGADLARQRGSGPYGEDAYFLCTIHRPVR